MDSARLLQDRLLLAEPTLLHTWLLKSSRRNLASAFLPTLSKKTPAILVFGGDTRIWTGDQSFADSCLTTWLCRHFAKKWSGKRGSNPRPLPWQGSALSTELFPQKTGGQRGNRTPDTGIFSPLLYRLSYLTDNFWRPEWGSNPRPLAWQASVLTNWTTRP